MITMHWQKLQRHTIFQVGTATVAISKNIVYIYDYENDLNESRREIKLLNQAFAVDTWKNSLKL
jgi:hypothetical protein